MAVLVARALAEADVWQPAAEFGRALASAPEHGFALPELPETLHPVALVQNDRSDPSAPATLRLRGPPEARFHLLLAAAKEPAQKFGRIEIALADDDVFRRELGDPRLAASFDARGEATIALAPDQAAGARFAVLVVLHDLLLASTDLSVRGVAGPIELR